MFLTLFGMGWDTFIPLSFFDQILSAIFFSKISKLFWRWKFTSIRLFWLSAQLIGSLRGSKYEHLSCFPTSCQTGLRPSFYAIFPEKVKIWECRTHFWATFFLISKMQFVNRIYAWSWHFQKSFDRNRTFPFICK